MYYPDACKRAERHFSAGNFYINDNGKVVLFYQQNTVAPRSTGFVTVVL
jgi:hypothetical protein